LGNEDSDLSSSDDEGVHVAAEHRLIVDELQEEPVVKKAIPRTIWRAGTLNKQSGAKVLKRERILCNAFKDIITSKMKFKNSLLNQAFKKS
jgi:hypothetical protein